MMRDEGYPTDWRHVTLHVSPDFKQIHADGDYRLGDHFRVLEALLTLARKVVEARDEYAAAFHDREATNTTMAEKWSAYSRAVDEMAKIVRVLEEGPPGDVPGAFILYPVGKEGAR